MATLAGGGTGPRAGTIAASQSRGRPLGVSARDYQVARGSGREESELGPLPLTLLCDDPPVSRRDAAPSREILPTGASTRAPGGSDPSDRAADPRFAPGPRSASSPRP